MSPEERLDGAVADIEAAGGRIMSTTPLARPESVHVVVAHWIAVASDSYDIWLLVEEALREWRFDTTGLVLWVDPDAEVIE